MPSDFEQVEWDEALVADCRALIQLALREDLGGAGDVTSAVVVDAGARGRADIVAREAGVLAGVGIPALVLHEFGADASWDPHAEDGAAVTRGDVVGRLEGDARALLACERTILNLVSRLSGVATLTASYVEAVAGTKAAVYDTRKTTPGWRRLEKFAVRCGGGSNHRLGLFEAVMLKDNHLAHSGGAGLTPADAVRRARAAAPGRVIEVEVDTLQQLAGVLPAGPDIVLLDNMAPDDLRRAVAERDARAPDVVLEASGGVRLATIGAIAASGVDRVSVGAITHAARGLDFGLDWL